MNRNHLALFEVVARSGGISKGAQLARISQPAVSKQIAELEDHLGVRLLDRLPRGCRLTEAGRILAGYATRWRALEQDAVRAIDEFRGLKSGRLALGASKTIGGYLLPSIISNFHRLYPSIELNIEIANTKNVQQALIQGTVEIGLTEGPDEWEELESKVFHRDELVVIAPPGHSLLRKKSVSIRDVCSHPLILREEGSGTRAVVENALRRKGIRIKPFLSLASPEAIKNSVAAGMGLAIVSRLVVSQEIQAGSLCVVPLKDLRIHRPLHLQCLRGKSPSPALQHFLKLLKKN